MTHNIRLSRRQLLNAVGMGLGASALRSLLAETQPRAINPLAPLAPPLPAKAKRVVHLFMNGGPSHVDTFDPKPALARYAGRPLPFSFKTERRTGAGYPSPFTFKNHGQSGIEISEIFPHLAQHADRLCVIRSMHTELPNHEPSLLMMNCGEIRQIRPSFGSWVTYGLGTENQNLPGFIALCPNGVPVQGALNWRSAFLPGAYQGTHIDTSHTEIDKLLENVRHRNGSLEDQRRQLDLLAALNRSHRQSRAEDPQLEARIQSFELAYRMQMEAADAFDLTKEPESVRARYGGHLYGRQLMIARRLLERGVRFVQVWTGAGQPWDNHNDIKGNLTKLAGETDRPIAALLTDLEERGLLDSTLVIWGGEFGRTPTVELPDNGANLGTLDGRDHNPYGFSMWLAGGGVRPGYVHGATDEFGFAAVENKVHVPLRRPRFPAHGCRRAGRERTHRLAARQGALQ
jgi:hypothetical protein